MEMPCLEIFIYFIIPILLGTYRHFNALRKKSLCHSLVYSSVSHSFELFFAVNLVLETGAARSVYAANTSCVDISVSH